MNNIVDTHCHLDLPQFDEDRSEVIDRALKDGVIKILIPGIELESCRKAINLAAANKSIYLAVGIHPNSGDQWNDKSVDEIVSLSKNNCVVAIGEIGLDYYWDKTSPKLQKKIFNAQLEIAKSQDLPVIVHIRESLDDTIDILINWQKNLVADGLPLQNTPGVVHSFSGSVEQAQSLVTHNFMIGITGPVTFKKAKILKNVVKEIPLDKLLIETDAPYLTPHPYRGKRNEPSYVKYVAEEISTLKNIDIDEVSLQTTNNASRLFRW